jgi:hypothetical protein
MNIPPYTLITYNRNKNGDPVGVLVAKKQDGDGSFTIGYSQCRKGDTFSKKMGLNIALGRCERFDAKYFNNIDSMPHTLRKMLPDFIRRCERYYKQGANV